MRKTFLSLKGTGMDNSKLFKTLRRVTNEPNRACTIPDPERTPGMRNRE